MGCLEDRRHDAAWARVRKSRPAPRPGASKGPQARPPLHSSRSGLALSRRSFRRRVAWRRCLVLTHDDRVDGDAARERLLLQVQPCPYTPAGRLWRWTKRLSIRTRSLNCPRGSRWREKPTNPCPRQWLWPQRRPRGARPPEWFSSEGSITEASSSTPTTRAARVRSCKSNPFAAALFHWFKPLHRQVRVTGAVEVVDASLSDAYWQSRPPGSRRSAVASHQSQVIVSRAVLEESVARLAEAFPDDSPPPRPLRWGGYRIQPEVVELWEEGADRLHDRLRYRLQSGSWRIERLSP